MIHVLDVRETFPIEGRGLVLAALWVPACTERICIGDEVELRSPSGEYFRTAIKAVELIRAAPRPDGQKPLGLMMADELPPSIGQKGTQIWKVGRSLSA